MLILVTIALVVIIIFCIFKHTKKPEASQESPEELAAARKSLLRVLNAVIATKKRKAVMDDTYNQLISLYHSNSRYSFLNELFSTSEKNFLCALDDWRSTYARALNELEKLCIREYRPETPIVSFDIMRETFEYIRDACWRCHFAMEQFADSSGKILEHKIIVEPQAEKVKRLLKDMPPSIHSSNITARTRPESLKDFVVIDVETTGLKAHVNEIIQLTAVKYESGTPTLRFNTYVKPRKGILSEAQSVNHITEKDVANAPYIEQVMEDFNRFVGKSLPLVGHNIFFDLRFLFVSGFNFGNKTRKFYDTLELSKKVYDSPSYKLDYLCRNELKLFLSGTHNASIDCLATGELFKSVARWLTA